MWQWQYMYMTVVSQGRGEEAAAGGALAVSSVTDYSHQPERVRSKAKIKPLAWPLAVKATCEGIETRGKKLRPGR